MRLNAQFLSLWSLKILETSGNREIVLHRQQRSQFLSILLLIFGQKLGENSRLSHYWSFYWSRSAKNVKFFNFFKFFRWRVWCSILDLRVIMICRKRTSKWFFRPSRGNGFWVFRHKSGGNVLIKLQPNPSFYIFTYTKIVFKTEKGAKMAKNGKKWAIFCKRKNSFISFDFSAIFGSRCARVWVFKNPFTCALLALGPSCD